MSDADDLRRSAEAGALAFLAPFSADPLLIPLDDPDNPTSTAALYDQTNGAYVPMKDGDWIVQADTTSAALVPMPPEDFVTKWEPVPAAT